MSEARSSRPDSPRPGRVTAGRGRGDTIVAIATAAGRAAVAVVRVSGPDAERIGRAVVTPWPTTARMLSRCTVRDPLDDSRIIDEALAVVFPAPASYTGETVLELHTHGGRYVPVAVHDALISAGARAALAGEFTERAVLNGKLDLVRAETVRELIDARTGAAHRSAIQALSGTLTRAYEELRADAIALEALMAFDIDFPDEDHGPLAREHVERAAADLLVRLEELTESAPTAILGRDGALVVLAGPPNAGKSTLFNALAGESRAIVSEEPGTTRDAIEILLDAEPWPMRLVDTAGLRASESLVEQLGMEVSERYLSMADVIVLCAEPGTAFGEMRARIHDATDATVVSVRTKADLGHEAAAADIVNVCAITGTGLADLRTRIMDAISVRAGTPVELPVAAVSARQRAALNVARSELVLFLDAWKSETLPAPVIATHLRAATHALDHLIGAVDSDDVLARVFATFCVGK